MQSSARIVLLVVGVSAAIATTFTKAQLPPKVALEIRSCTLTPGAQATFHQRFITDSLPLLRRWGIDVVAYGPSQHDDVTYYLMRAFPSRSERDRVEAAFYASAEWQNGRSSIERPIHGRVGPAWRRLARGRRPRHQELTLGVAGMPPGGRR